jgi:hypothetical protein
MNPKVITITFSNPTLRHLYVFHNLIKNIIVSHFSTDNVLKKIYVISVMFTAPVLSYFNVFHISSC